MRDGMQIQLYEAKTTWRSSAKAAIKTTSAGLVGGRSSIDDRVRVDVHAVLAAEPDNPYDPNAIAVWVQGLKVGYLVGCKY
jgi:hypothetical protein